MKTLYQFIQEAYSVDNKDILIMDGVKIDQVLTKEEPNKTLPLIREILIKFKFVE